MHGRPRHTKPRDAVAVVIRLPSGEVAKITTTRKKGWIQLELPEGSQITSEKVLTKTPKPE